MITGRKLRDEKYDEKGDVRVHPTKLQKMT